MMTKRNRVLGLATFLAIATAAPAAWAEIIKVTLLQLNDVYEITPVEGDRWGGLARVATLRQALLADNPNTFTLLAGDFLSPSALGTAKVDGEPLAGAQVVAALNTMGLDFVTFGNHEFDVKEAQLLARLEESNFQWISGNVARANGEPFPGVLPAKILAVPGEQGGLLSIGIIGTTLRSNPADYVAYGEPIAALQQQVDELGDRVDITIALTHLSLSQDQQVAAEIPEVDLIMGGHEHENIQQWRFDPVSGQAEGCPDQPTPILKADANARTVYVIDLLFDTETKCFEISTRLQPVTAALADEPATAKVVNAWVEKGFAGFRSSGFEPGELVAVYPQPLDGLEASVRNRPTGLTELIAEAMLTAAGAETDLAIFNSGSIRIDDVLPPGQITQYDVIRMMPFGGKVLTVEMSGELLGQVLNQGVANKGTGGYLQTANVQWDEGSQQWNIAGQALEATATYQVAINDFLMSGRETGLEFLTLEASGVALLNGGEDIRFAVIQQLRIAGASAQALQD